jgi:hypothetical protein
MFHLLLVDFRFGPLEGGGVLIPARDKGFDRLDQHFDASKAGSLWEILSLEHPSSQLRYGGLRRTKSDRKNHSGDPQDTDSLLPGCLLPGDRTISFLV